MPESLERPAIDMPERIESTHVTQAAKEPVRRAVVVVEPGRSELRVAALTVFDRLLVALHRAGFLSITVVSACPPPPAPRAGAWGVTFLQTSAIPAIEGLTLIVRGEVLLQAGDLKRLASEGGRLVGSSGERFPVGVVSGEGSAWETDIDLLPPTAAEGVAKWVRNAGEAEEAGRVLWASLKSSSDGWVDRVFNRPLGRPLARGFSRTWVTPNQISMASILVGVLSGVLFGFGHHGWSVAAALLFQASAVLDCVDGDVARIVFKESPLGKWLDLVGDQLVHVSVFGGIAVGLWRAGVDAPVAWLGIAAVVGALLSFWMVLRAMKTAGPKAGNPALGRILEAATNRDFSVVVLVLACVNRLEVFLWLAAIGTQVFWVMLWGLHARGRATSRGGS